MGNFDDIIFRNRNKEYGAFQLRQRYFSVLTFSVIVTLAVFIAVMLIIHMNYGHQKMRTAENWYIYNADTTGLNQNPEKKDQPPPAGGNNSIHVVVPEVVDSMTVNDTLRNSPDGNGQDTTGKGSGQGDGNSDGPVFFSVQEPPLFPGGDTERIKFLQHNIIYPPEARIKKIHGKVYIGFIVEKDGSISNARVIKGIGYGCDEEALRVIISMPAWKPGRQNGSAVRVFVNWPIVF